MVWIRKMAVTLKQSSAAVIRLGPSDIYFQQANHLRQWLRRNPAYLLTRFHPNGTARKLHQVSTDQRTVFLHQSAVLCFEQWRCVEFGARTGSPGYPKFHVMNATSQGITIIARTIITNETTTAFRFPFSNHSLCIPCVVSLADLCFDAFIIA